MKETPENLYPVVLKDTAGTQIGRAQCQEAEFEQARANAAAGLSAPLLSLLADRLRPKDQHRFP
jgi:hypothetical protein